MYKFILLQIFLFNFCLLNTLKGQELISPAGKTAESSGYSISWSLGELVIDTWSAQNITVTNGFHQPGLTVTNIFKDQLPDFIINLYPNPTSDFLFVETKSDKRFNYHLFSSDGKLLATELLQLEKMQIDFQHFTPGIYLLRVVADDELVGIYQIIKK